VLPRVVIASDLLQFDSFTSSTLHQSTMSRAAQRAAGASMQTVQPFKELLKGDCAALKRYIEDGGSINAREKISAAQNFAACGL
jgi:hypothetical protein